MSSLAPYKYPDMDECNLQLILMDIMSIPHKDIFAFFFFFLI